MSAVTTPVPDTVASADETGAIDHVPGVVASCNGNDAPWQITIGAPDTVVIDAGWPITVMLFVCWHPDPSEYVIVAVPGLIPYIYPLKVPAEATIGALLVQLPPGTPSVNKTESPTQTVAGPVTTVGDGVTLTVTFDVHPVGAVQVITVDEPVGIPVTIPVVNPTEAFPGILLPQVEPGILDDNVAIAPTHNPVGPVITGKGLMLTVTVPVIVLKQPDEG